MKAATPNRIVSIDILRGLVMIIMALDHTRDFFHISAVTGDPLNGDTTTPLLFFTRWITHFCAPTFVLLSGLSAYLSSSRKTTDDASFFMIKRGLWLVVVEIVFVTLGLTFNPSYNFIFLQVIWAIGWSMVILGLLMRLSNKLIFVVGLLLVLGHNAIDYIKLEPKSTAQTVTNMLLGGTSFFPISSTRIIASLYSILPWTGIMLLGYSMGPWFTNGFPAERRKRLLMLTGTSLILLFVVLRLLRGYGDPGAWQPAKHWFYSLLNTSKYPPSLQFVGMTLGPSLLFLAFFENIHAGWTKVVSVYGRVPFFYYILHFYLLHSILVILFYATGHTNAQIVDPQVPFYFRPTNFGFSLPIVYLIWLSAVAILYRPCRWFNHYKATHQQWWLRYV